jgi:hypothetical protein
MTTAIIQSDIYYYLQDQNANRGLAGEEVQKDYYDLVPLGGNVVDGIDGISAGAPAEDLSLGSSLSVYNTMVFNGDHSTSAAASGAGYDNYAFSVNTNGTVTVLDENTGQSEQITHVSYLLFDGAHKNSDGSYQSLYIVAGGSDAQIAALYNAALGRQPDLPGLEYYGVRIANGQLDLHQAAVYFLASPEFLAKYPALSAPTDNGGPNDQAFINELYGNILHRTPNASEVGYYVDALQGTLTTSTGALIPAADRAQLLVYFSQSPENQADISGWLINTSTGYADTGVPVATSDAALHLVGVSAAHPVVG